MEANRLENVSKRVIFVSESIMGSTTVAQSDNFYDTDDEEEEEKKT